MISKNQKVPGFFYVIQLLKSILHRSPARPSPVFYCIWKHKTSNPNPNLMVLNYRIYTTEFLGKKFS